MPPAELNPADTAHISTSAAGSRFGPQLACNLPGRPMERDTRDCTGADEPEARYANYFHVGHNAFEVMLEFGQHYEGVSQPRMHTRIIAAPVYAKALLGLLETAISQYEKSFGPIAARGAHE
jgi:hypothetical protein